MQHPLLKRGVEPILDQMDYIKNDYFLITFDSFDVKLKIKVKN